MCVDKTSRTVRWVVDGQVRPDDGGALRGVVHPDPRGPLPRRLEVARPRLAASTTPRCRSRCSSAGGQAVHYSSDFAARGYAGATHGCVNVRDYEGIKWLFDQVQRRRQGRHLLVVTRSGSDPQEWHRSPRRLLGRDQPTATDVPAGASGGAHRRGGRPDALPGSLLDLLPTDEPMTWLRRGEGMVAWGVAARCRTNGPDRFADAADWWRRSSGSAVVADEVEVPGTGLISLGSFGFADDPGDTVLVVPRSSSAPVADASLGHGHRAGRARRGRRTSSRSPPRRRPRNVTFADGAMSGAAWESVVGRGRRRIGSGELDKVVLARDLVATADADIDVRWPLRQLADRLRDVLDLPRRPALRRHPRAAGPPRDAAWSPPGCWPARSGVPATTSTTPAWPVSWPGPRRTSRSTSTPSARSPTSLAPYCSSMNVPEVPVRAAPAQRDAPGHRRRPGSCTTPTAPACSSSPPRCTPPPRSAARPTKVAVELIAELEGMDRGRYAGPVGWIDAARRRRVRHRAALRRDRRPPGPALRRLRHRRRLRPRGRAGRGAGQVPARARRPHRRPSPPTSPPPRGLSWLARTRRPGTSLHAG